MTPRAVLRFLVRHAMHIAFFAMLLYFAVKTSDHAPRPAAGPGGGEFCATCDQPVRGHTPAFPGRFGTPENILNIFNQNFPYFILGVGMTLVIVSGGIDLSVGSLVALCGVVATSVMMTGGVILTDGGASGPRMLRLLPAGTSLGAAMAAGAALALLAGAGIGAFNGWMVTQFKIPPFIATLAWFMTARGLAYKFCAAKPIGNLSDAFTWLGQGQIGPTLFHVGDRPQKLWFPILVALLIAAAIHFVLTQTRFGRYVFAVGGNEEAARLSGIRVNRQKLWVYTLNGLLAGLCGILLAARLQAGDPKVGQQPPLELGAITAVVLGGASLTGGKGSIAGTLFGALFMGVLDNGLALQGMQYFDQLVVKGVVLLAAVLFDQMKDRV